MLQELEGVGYAWESVKTMAKNWVQWRIPVDALFPPPPPPPRGAKGMMMNDNDAIRPMNLQLFKFFSQVKLDIFRHCYNKVLASLVAAKLIP